MFNPARDLQPERPEKTNETANLSQVNTPPPRGKEPPSPSQVGRFLGALEKTKDEKKLQRGQPEDSQAALEIGEDGDEETDSSANQGLFGLVKSKSTKGNTLIESSLTTDDLMVDERRPSKGRGKVIESTDFESDELPDVKKKEIVSNPYMPPQTPAHQGPIAASTSEAGSSESPNQSIVSRIGGMKESVSEMQTEPSTSLSYTREAKFSMRSDAIQNSSIPSPEESPDSFTPRKTILSEKGLSAEQLSSSEQAEILVTHKKGTDKKTSPSLISDSSSVDEVETSDPRILKEPEAVLPLVARSAAHDNIQVRAENATARTQQIVALVEQIASAIRTIETKDIKFTEIKLKQPPVFEGATLTVTSYSSATKEYNITFSDLSPDARRLIEVKSNEDLLRASLIEKGYTLRQVTIEAMNLSSPTTADTSSKGDTLSRQGKQNSGSFSRDKDRDETLFS